MTSPERVEALAEAWDRGMRTGTSRAMRHMSDEPGLPLASEADNPYLANPMNAILSAAPADDLRVRQALNEIMTELQSAVAEHLCDRIHEEGEASPCIGCTESVNDLLGLRWDQRIMRVLLADPGAAS